MQLRDYQIRIADECEAAARAGRHPLILAPTGAGKTIIIAELARRARGRVIVLAPWRVLVDQTASVLARCGLEVGVAMAGRDRRDARVMVGSVETVSRWGIEPAELVILDEAHRHDTAARRRVIERCRAPGGIVVGCTATGWGPRGPLSGYDRAVVGPSPRELVDAGMLRRPRFYGRPVLAELLDADPRARGIAFCASVDEARDRAREIRRATGAAARAIWGTMPERDRAAGMAAYESGSVRALTNYGVLSEGFDGVVDAVDLRSRMNLRLYVQAIGRALRPTGGREAAIGDPGGLVSRYGSPLDMPWPVWGEAPPGRTRRPCRDCAELVTEPEAEIHRCEDIRRTVPTLEAIAAEAGLGAVWTAEQYAARGVPWRAGEGRVRAELDLERRARGLGPGWVTARLYALGLA